MCPVMVRSLPRRQLSAFLKGSMNDVDIASQEVGVVSRVGDGIAYIDGVDHAMYGEILVFDNGVKAMVQDIREHEIGCILLGKDTEIEEGSRVARTGKDGWYPGRRWLYWPCSKCSW